MLNSIIVGDCLDIMSKIPDNSINLVITDLPYSQTPLEWDKEVSLPELWKHYKRICKPSAAILLFGQEPFASHLRISNLKDYKYDWCGLSRLNY